jgi:penicillin-binding protein 1B
MTPDATKPNRPSWKSVARLWRRRLFRKRYIILASVAIPLLMASIATGSFYFHYAKLTDEQLRGGAFQHSVDVYASPLVLSDGDGFTRPELAAVLRQAGFAESGTGHAGTFRMNDIRANTGTTDLYVADGSNTIAVRATVSDNRRITRIEVGGHNVKTWTAGTPLMASLTSSREISGKEKSDREKRHLITFREIPPVLVHAVVSAEDKHFFQHSGLDLPRVAKAAYVDFREGRKEQGASTLTMQLVRGLWLQPEKQWKRKLAEAMMTIHLERKWSKEEIFETYANQVFLGRQSAYSIHGFAEGAQVFFGKPMRELSVADAALLAGMVQRPSYFNPYRHPERARERRDLVLNLMRSNHYIDAAQYQAAVDAPLTLAPVADRDDSYGEPFFLDLLNDEVQEIGQPGSAAKKVYTTIDLNLQRAAGEAVTAGMEEVDKLLAKRYGKSAGRAEAALIAIDPHTGEIKAMVGGRDYAKSQLNRILAKRPPGSVFKPFVYAAALNTGITGGDHVFTPATTVDDAPADFQFNGQSYQPANYRQEVFGTLTLRKALAKSDNVAAVKVAQSVGYGAVVAMARRAGLNDDIKATPSVALGSYAVTPLEMAAAWTMFANGGLWVKPQMVTQVRDSDGDTIRTEQHESRQALDPRVAYLMVNMLQEVMRSGTAAGVRSRGFLLPAAGKTGTSHDGWFAGFTSQLLCLVWVGFDDYRELNLEGARSALPIWTEFMKKASRFAAYRNAVEFPRPSGIGSARICDESGKLAGDLCVDSHSEVFLTGTEPKDVCALHVTEPVVAIPLATP